MKCIKFIAIMLFFCSCGGDDSTEARNTGESNNSTSIGDESDVANGKGGNGQKKFQNIVVLLDLSSRIKLENQVEKDQKIITNLLTSFEQTQRKYAFQASKDKISIALAYQSSSPYNLYNIGNDKFLIDMEYKSGKPMNKPEFDKKKKDFQNAVSQLYQKAYESPTDGADIWGFFCSDWSNIYQKDKVNKVVILTDGYLEFDKKISVLRPKGTFMTGFNKLRNKSNWENLFVEQNLKLNPCLNNLENIKVLIVEVAPKNKNINTNEFLILKKFWSTWFTDMNVESEIFKTEDISDNVIQKIAEFVKN